MYSANTDLLMAFNCDRHISHRFAVISLHLCIFYFGNISIFTYKYHICSVLILVFQCSGTSTNFCVPQLRTYPSASLEITEGASFLLEEVDCWKFNIWFQLQGHLFHILTLVLVAISNRAVLLILNSLSSRRWMKIPSMTKSLSSAEYTNTSQCFTRVDLPMPQKMDRCVCLWYLPGKAKQHHLKIMNYSGWGFPVTQNCAAKIRITCCYLILN